MNLLVFASLLGSPVFTRSAFDGDPVRTRHRTVPVSEVEQRLRSADSGGERRSATAQQLGGETLLPQIHLLCQRMVRNSCFILRFMTKVEKWFHYV